MELFSTLLLSTCLAVCSAEPLLDNHNHDVPTSVTEGDVIRDLMSRDVKYGRPDTRGPSVVRVWFYVQSLTQVNFEQSFVDTDGFLSLEWEDPRLRFQYSPPFHGVTNVVLPRDEVWAPDIELFNHVAPGMQILNQARDSVVVSYNGTVRWYPQVSLRSHCPGLDSKKTQFFCTLVFGSWAQTIEKIDLSLNQPFELSMYEISGQWNVSSVTSQRVATKYECCPATYVQVLFILDINQRDV